MGKSEIINFRVNRVLNKMDDAIIGFSPEFKVTSWNPAAEEIFKHSSIQTLGQSIFDLITPKDRVTDDLRDFKKVFEGKTIRQKEIYRQSGEQRIITSAIIFPIYDDDNQIIGGNAIIRDETEAYKKNQLLREALELGLIGSWEILVGNNLTFQITQQAQNLLKIDPQKKITDLSQFISCFDPEDQEKLNTKIEHAILHCNEDEMEVRRVFSEEKIYNYKIRWKCETFLNRIVRVYGTIQDITAEIERKEKITQQQTQMLMNYRLAAIGELSAGIAHEINNPIAIIDGYMQNIEQLIGQNGTDNENMVKFIDKINKATKRITKIVTSLRRFSRNGKSEDFEIIPVRNIVEDTLEFCQERLEDSNISVRIGRIPDDLKIACHPTEISQVLLNLINNSHDAIVHRVGDQWLEIEANRHENGSIEISVTDSGTGIPEEIRDKVMEPFFTTKKIGKGTGLGLSISHGIIRAHNGKLIIDKSCKNTRITMSFQPVQNTSDKHDS